ncbi:MAG: hypothetical protein K2X66_08900 [Cyanobacteria bacterium]|nr:hypothetical protein [Cyanobacteriota bacterium]
MKVSKKLNQNAPRTLEKEARLPTLGEFGEKSPTTETLNPYRQMAFRMIHHQFPQVTEDNFQETGLRYHQAAQLILPQLKESGQTVPGRLHRLFEKEIDVIEHDSLISGEELALFLYKAVQANHRDGLPTSEDILVARGLSDKHYLLETAKALRLPQFFQKKLFHLMVSNQFTVSQGSLEECYDLKKHRTEALPGFLKAIQAAKNWDDILLKLKSFHWGGFNPEKLKTKLLETFAHSANMPAVVELKTANTGMENPGKMIFQQFILHSSPTLPGVEKLKLFLRKMVIKVKRKKAEIKGAAAPSSKHFKPQFKKKSPHPLGTFWVKSPQSYRILPHPLKEAMSSTDTTSPLSAEKQLASHLNHLATTLTEALQSKGYFTPAFQQGFQANFQDIFKNPESLDTFLQPIYQEINTALNLNQIPLCVIEALTNDEDETLDVFGMYDTGINRPDQTNSEIESPTPSALPTIYLSYQGFFNYANLHSKKGVKVPVIISTLLKKLLWTLVEESVHATQHQGLRESQTLFPQNALPPKTEESTGPASTGFPVERLEDYAENLQWNTLPEHGSKSLMGSQAYYLEQPLELDAKTVAEHVVKKLLG